jgi:hypothetical protein
MPVAIVATRDAHLVELHAARHVLVEPAMLVRLCLIASLLVPATALADDEPTTSYRSMTLTADAVGIGMLVAGGYAEGENGRDTDASNALFAVGGLTTLFATPIIHIARGHKERGVGSILMRGGLAGLGMAIAFSANNDCHDDKNDGLGDPDFLCELDYVGYGVLGGLIAASVIDAAFMTDEKVERATWAPQAWANQHGAGAGVALTW